MIGQMPRVSVFLVTLGEQADFVSLPLAPATTN